MSQHTVWIPACDFALGIVTFRTVFPAASFTRSERSVAGDLRKY